MLSVPSERVQPHTGRGGEGDTKIAVAGPVGPGLAYAPSRTLSTASDTALWRAYAKPDKTRRKPEGCHHFEWLVQVGHWSAYAEPSFPAGFLVAISLAFSSTSSIDWMVALDVAATAFYALDILVQLHTGFVVTRWDLRREVVMDGPTATRFYILHGYFKWDFPAVLAIIPEAILLGCGGGSVSWKIFYMLRLLRLLRWVRFTRVIWYATVTAPLEMLCLSTAALYGLGVIWTLAVMINSCGCFLWWLAQVEGLENSWANGPYISQPQLHAGLLIEQAPTVQWLYSNYWALSAITTAVYGDAVATTVPELVTVMVFDFFSIFWWSVIVVFVFQVLQAVSRSVRRVSGLIDRLNDVEAWMQGQVPPSLQREIRQYYAKVWAEACDGEELAALPGELRGQVVWNAAGSTLRQLCLLRCMPTEALEWLASRAQAVRLLQGHDLFNQGDDSGGCIYVLQAGELSILRGWKQVAAVAAPALIGQATLLGALEHAAEGERAEAAVGGRREHTVRATSTCALWKLSCEDIATLATEEVPGAAAALVCSYDEYLEEVLKWAGVGRLPPQALSIQAALTKLLLPKGEKGARREIPSQPPPQQQQQAQQQALDKWLNAAAATFMQQRASRA